MSPAAATTEPRELVLVKGSSKSFEIVLVDAEGNPESLSGWDRASFRVLAKIGDATPILSRDTAAGNLAVDVPTSTLTATLSQAEADALVPGFYVGEAAVRYSAGSKWFHTRLERVRIRASIAHHPA